MKRETPAACGLPPGLCHGAALPPSFGVALVRADGLSYCLQSGIRGSEQYFVGLAGPTAAGPC